MRLTSDNLLHTRTYIHTYEHIYNRSTEHKLREGAVHSKYSGLCMYKCGSELQLQREHAEAKEEENPKKKKGLHREEEKEMQENAEITLVVG